MRRACHLALIFGITMIGGAHTADIQQLESYFEQEDFDRLAAALESHENISSADPKILFFKGFVHQDADSAIKYYKHVITSFPKSAYADYAFFRLGQYFYFEGQYSVARRYFSRVFRNHPESDLKDDSQYLYCQSIIAQGKVDSARLFLKAFVQNTKRSPYVDAAILDLESLGGLPQTSLIQSVPASTNISFAIQVASYKSFDDAKSALHKLSRVFPHVQVGQKTLGNTTYYHLLVGRFDSKAKAAEYAKLYIKPHLSEYKVVELNL